MTTREIGDLAYKNKDRGHGIEHVPGVVTFPGGVPIITKSGAHLGGIGVSGATADQDEGMCQISSFSDSRELNDRLFKPF